MTSEDDSFERIKVSNIISENSKSALPHTERYTDLEKIKLAYRGLVLS
jgi:hypothetical protein